MTKVSNSVAYASGLVYILVSAAVNQTEVSYGLMLLGIKSTLLALRTWCGVNVYECLLFCTIFNFSERNKFKLWKESHFRKGDMDITKVSILRALPGPWAPTQISAPPANSSALLSLPL